MGVREIDVDCEVSRDNFIALKAAREARKAGNEAW
jgi:hypothetical protein